MLGDDKSVKCIVLASIKNINLMKETVVMAPGLHAGQHADIKHELLALQLLWQCCGLTV